EATAAGHTGAAHLVVVDTGNNQFGVAGDALPRPLVAVVVDAGSNRLANVPVTFAVTKGAGSFSGQPTVTIQTDSDGRAIVRPTLDALAGEDNNIFTATAPGAVSSAAFMASGRTAGPAASTRISGVILDNTTIPIAGVSVRVEGTMMVTQTNAQGQFSLDGAPVGYVKLLIDGSTAQRAGTWPTLEYALYTLPGVDNDVGMPIYLLPIDVSRGVFTDDTTGGTLTLPELPGFKLEIAPGSATFPGGGRTGTVSATLVHADRMPMVPGFGQQPKFLLTIQPAGTHFDPPARLTFPNVDGLKPGEVTEMYSFDHDLGQFVAIGTGTVSDDGSVVTSDPGVGIIKGGWHCGGNPLPPSTWSNCTECEVCTLFGGCEPRSPLTPACSPDNSPCTWDVCRGRECAHIRPRVTIVSVTSPDNFRISAEPRMPRIVARAKVEVPGAPIPDTTPTAEFEWTVTMRWEAPKDVVEHTYGPYRGGAEWSPPPFTDIYGGTMIVKARLIRNGFGCMIAESRPVEVTATNPPVAQIVNRLHAQDSDFNELERDVLDGVICVESQNTMRQFTEAGYPRMNVTSDQRGAGLMQLTPPEDPRAYWDWRLNVDGGLDVFREKRDAATEYFSRHPEVPPTDTEMLRETIGLYNGGHQYDFENGRWDERDFSDPDRDAYVDAVIKRRCF
ncbi:MAG TPA: hypothetical protein VFV49_16115, partial [Thermoanaerobaculia bacterium]|nr:hypothetical protein [Thermoanaerobaculia bacterium]